MKDSRSDVKLHNHSLTWSEHVPLVVWYVCAIEKPFYYYYNDDDDDDDDDIQ
jgi:hypothetical protein